MSFDPFRQLSSKTIRLPQENIDTDQIIPARFLTTTERAGLADAAFHDWRYDASGQLIPGHPLNAHDLGDRQILIAGDNFGCGSSREHAAWALTQYGIRAVISTKMGDIFKSNSMKNGLLTIIVPPEAHAAMMAAPDPTMNIDLEAGEIRFGNHVVPFEVEAFARLCLLEGKDSLEFLADASPEITAFEEARP